MMITITIIIIIIRKGGNCDVLQLEADMAPVISGFNYIYNAQAYSTIPQPLRTQLKI